MPYFSHPLTQDQITEENYRDVASNLLDFQLIANIEQQVLMLKYGWGDDDTDYFRSALHASERLMDIAYDGTREDLINFLFTPQSDEPHVDESLHDLYSAGGFCSQLNRYIDLLEEE